MNRSTTFFFHPKWPLYYEDNHLLVLYKPAGLLMQGDRTRDISLLDLAKQWIKARYEKQGRVFLGLVHRLDRPVAGVILFCRTSKSAARLNEQFRTGNLHKRYVAVVEGKMMSTSGELIHHIEREGSSSRIAPHATVRSKEARLIYRVLDTAAKGSLVEIKLKTGRHHQIRAQLSHLGFPILGDLRYGASGPLPRKQIALFADQLTITHPTLKTKMSFSSPLPMGWPWPYSGDNAERPLWNWKDVSPEVMPFVRPETLTGGKNNERPRNSAHAEKPGKLPAR